MVVEAAPGGDEDAALKRRVQGTQGKVRSRGRAEAGHEGDAHPRGGKRAGDREVTGLRDDASRSAHAERDRLGAAGGGRGQRVAARAQLAAGDAATDCERP